MKLPFPLLTSPHGRINRARFWIGVLVIFAISVAVGLLLLFLGFGRTVTGTMTTQVDGAPAVTGTYYKTSLSAVGALIVSIVTFIPAAFILLKRRHDRGGNGYDAIGIMTLLILLQVADVFGVGGLTISLLGFLALAGVIYLFVVLGCLRGTPGPNAYGPNPLQN